MTAALLLAAALAAPDPPAADPPAAQPPSAESPAADAPAEPAPLTDPQKLSYALGVNVGRSLLADGLDPDPALFLAGLRAALTDEPVRLSDEEIAAALAEAAERVRKTRLDARAAENRRRAAASRDALAALAARPGTSVLPTGEVVTFEATGDGPKPPPTGRVRLHYTARLAGEADPFFTTRPPAVAEGGGEEGGEPAAAPIEVAVEELLPGLRAVLPTVPAGSVASVGLPPDRAYGPAGGPEVPPNAALEVTVELLAVLPSPAAVTAPAGTPAPGKDESPAAEAGAP